MKNPLREMSRPKALATAGIVAGAVALSGVAAAVNVGLLTGNDSAPFKPQKVVATTANGSVTTTSTTEPPVEIVYKDVYEQAPAPPATAGPAAPAPAASSSGSDHSSADPSGGSGTYAGHTAGGSYVDDEGHESEDHESEDHESEDDGFDD